ncbi:MAG TPA: hypothetical protein VGK73_29115 [Polyangiaceae bacterium]
MQRKFLGLSSVTAVLVGFLALAGGCSGGSDSADDSAETGGGGGRGGGITIGDAGQDGNSGGRSATGGTSGNEAGETGTGGTIGVTGGTTGTTGGTGFSGSSGSTSSLCGDSCVCSNGLDDDGDGLVDGFDPECIGPTDNDEGSFATGIPGDNRDPKWQDCFFDGNSGAGDDGCRYASECLTGEYDQDHEDCTVTQQCLDYCIDRTPSGCDCFGCCTVGLTNGESVDVLTLTSCSLDNIEDEEACPRCEKSTQCENDCGECELCLGKTEADLPESCSPPPTGEGGAPGTGEGGAPGTPPPPTYTCDDGLQVCSAEVPCPGDQYCRLGCCTELFIR